MVGAGLGLATGCLDQSGDQEPTSDPGPDSPATTPPPSRPTTEPPTATTESARLVDPPPSPFSWAFEVGEEIPVGPIAHDGLVLVANSRGTVRGLEAGSGRVAWRFDAPRGIGGTTGKPFALFGGTLFVASGTTTGTAARSFSIHALDPATGTERWQYAIAGGSRQGVLGPAAGGVVVVEGDDALGPDGDRTALVEFDGGKRWVAETGDARAVASGEGQVYVGARSAIRAFDARSGAERWRTDATPSYLGLAADDRRLYVVEETDGDPHQRLVGRSGATGNRAWAADWFATSVTRRGDDGVVAGGEHLVSVAPDGAERWRFEPGGSATDPVRNGVLFTGTGGDVVAVSLDDGVEHWRATVDATYAFPAAQADGVVVSSYLDGARYFAHDTADGTRRWSLDLAGDHLEPPAAGDGMAFFPDRDGRLYARAL